MKCPHLSIDPQTPVSQVSEGAEDMENVEFSEDTVEMMGTPLVESETTKALRQTVREVCAPFGHSYFL